MESSAQIFAIVMTTIVCSIGALTIIGVGARVVLARAAKQRQLMGGAVVSRDDGRMQRIEEAVESIAVEVERISEAQRFTARLMAERLPERVADMSDASPSALRRVVTPH